MRLDRDAEPEAKKTESFDRLYRPFGLAKGSPFIASDGVGEAVLLEQPQEGLDHRRLLRRFEGFASEHVAGGLIGHRQGVTVAAIAELELALEIGAPQIIGRYRRDESSVPSALQRRLWRARLTRPRRSSTA